MIPIDAEVEPCRTFMPGARAHRGSLSDVGGAGWAGADGLSVRPVAVAGLEEAGGWGVEMIVREAMGSRG